MKGIMKLRLVVTFLFLMMIVTIALSFVVSDIEYEAELEFYDELTEDEWDELIEIYEKYPTSDTVGIYGNIGICLYIVTGGLFILMVKVWGIQNISSKDKRKP